MHPRSSRVRPVPARRPFRRARACPQTRADAPLFSPTQRRTVLRQPPKGRVIPTQAHAVLRGRDHPLLEALIVASPFGLEDERAFALQTPGALRPVAGVAVSCGSSRCRNAGKHGRRSSKASPNLALERGVSNNQVLSTRFCCRTRSRGDSIGPTDERGGLTCIVRRGGAFDPFIRSNATSRNGVLLAHGQVRRWQSMQLGLNSSDLALRSIGGVECIDSPETRSAAFRGREGLSADHHGGSDATPKYRC